MKKHILFAIFLALALTSHAADIYVSPKGSDTAGGTQAQPLATLRIALRKARDIKRLGKAETVTIHVAKGTYHLYETLRIRPEDSGTVIDGDGAIIDGGVSVTGWRRQGKLLVAPTPESDGNLIDFRQLYINGKKAVRARDVADFDDMAHILSLDKPSKTIFVPATPAVRSLAKAYATGGNAPAEMVLHEMWCVANLRIKGIRLMGDSAAVTFHEPEATIQFEHPWPCPMVNTKPFKRDDGRVLNLNSAFYLTNSAALLDKPGEWYHDTRRHLIYYYPLKGENISEAIVPALETLVEVQGTPDRPVGDVTIKGVTFTHSTWLRPSVQGHVPLQAGMYLLEGYKLRPQTVRPDRNNGLDNQGFLGRPAAAVSVSGAENVRFTDCHFTALGSTGIDYEHSTTGGSIAGCLFDDIAGNAILGGSFSPSSLETHLPYDPADRRVVTRGLIVANNTIHDVTTEDWGTHAIALGYVADCIIAHNEIHDVSYTAISLGWGWTQSVNCMRGNEVWRNHISRYARHMYDCAGIYTLGAQPKTFITENVVENIYHPVYAHDPNHWFYLYCDEGSSFITVRDNWTEGEKYLKNSNGPGCVWENNGPAVSDTIRRNAGPKPGLDLATLRAVIQTKKKK